MHAVDPKQVAQNKKMLTQSQITERVLSEFKHTEWVTLSGGNPCLWEFGTFINNMHDSHKKVALETQGTYWRGWVPQCDLITVSPKAPSMGYDWTDTVKSQLDRWYHALSTHPGFNFKVVVFNKDDLAYARALRQRYQSAKMFLSIGNNWLSPQESVEGLRNNLLTRYDFLSNMVLRDEHLKGVAILPQLHVLVNGNAEGI